VAADHDGRRQESLNTHHEYPVVQPLGNVKDAQLPADRSSRRRDHCNQ
jgi:hypothetical protein